MKASDQAFVEDIMAEGDDPPTPVDWNRLTTLLHTLNTASPHEREELFRQAWDVAGESEAAKALVARKQRTLGLTK